MNNISDKNLKVIPLGGVEEIGFNSTIYEYDDKIVVVDLGLGFPDANMYGIDYIVPNTEYLKKRKENIEGILLTHGHLDHIGALPFLLPQLDFPDVYGTEFTIELLKTKLEEHNILPQCKLHVVTEASVLSSGPFKVRFFRVNHSIPQSVGMLIETPAAKVIHTGDFKFDNSPINEPVADYAKIAQMGTEGVDLLLADSTNSLKKGHPISETDVANSISDVIERAKGRVIVSAFSGLVGRLYQVIQIAEQQNRKVAIAGYSMQQTLRIAQEINYIKPKAGLIVPIQKINRYKDGNIMILTTGSQGEGNAALARMATGEYKSFSLKKGDTVILSASTIPGNNKAVQGLIDDITSTGAKVHQSDSLDYFTSGHGYQEDQKIMLNLVKPKYFMPIHGYQYFLREHGRTAEAVGIPERNIIIPKRGAIIEGNKYTGFRVNGQIKSTPLLVSGLGVGDIGASVLAERQQLANYGAVVVSINVDRQTRKVVGEPFITTKGFVYVKASRDLLTDLASLVKEKLSQRLKKMEEPSDIKYYLEGEISHFLEGEIGRDPAAFILLNFIEQPRRQNPQPRQRQERRERQPQSQQQQPHPRQAAPQPQPQQVLGQQPNQQLGQQPKNTQIPKPMFDNTPRPQHNI